VFFGHGLPADSAIAPGLRAWGDSLAAHGVDLFFAISGYLVGGIALREVVGGDALAAPRFWIRRWLRTLPAYLVTLALYLVKERIVVRPDRHIVPWHYLLFLQTYIRGGLCDFGHSWSLCVEEHFYLALPLLLLVLGRLARGRRPLLRALLGIALLVVTVRTAISLFVPLDEKLSHNRTDGLLFGVALAAMEEAGVGPTTLGARGRRALALLAGAWWALAFWFERLGLTGLQPAFALASALVAAMAIARDRALEDLGGTRPVAWLARVSYSFYLLHPLVLGVQERLYFGARGDRPGYLAVHLVLGALGAAIAAHLQHALVEKPVLALRDRWAPGGDPMTRAR
jgi:peptidoglycan/LPS O-acetylase OafA/YrhL